MAERKIRVTAPSRLHLGLIDLSGVSARRYGGIGITTAEPSIQVDITSIAGQSLVTTGKLDAEALADVSALLQRAGDRNGAVNAQIDIRSMPPQHSGFGTKTALLLAIVTGLDKLFGWNLSPDELRLLTRRGGTSGVGVHSFFSGGVIVDAGQMPRGPIEPSRYAMIPAAPLLQVRAVFPEEWRIMLFLPPGHRMSGSEERAFFQTYAPIPRIESYQSFAVVYHGILPALLTKDLTALRMATAELCRTGFKRYEIDAQHDSVRALLTAFSSIDGLATGMSSLGPLVYAVTRAVDTDTQERARSIAARLGAALVAITAGANAGAKVEDLCG